MATMSGADTDQLDDLGRRMAQAADHLDTVRHEVTAALGRAQWEGDDAADFHGLWNHRLAGLLQSTTTATRDASTRLHRNAAEQRVASGTDSGSPTAVLTRAGGGPSDDGVDRGGLWKEIGDVWDKGSLIAGGVMLGKDVLERYSDVKAIGKFLDKPWVDKVVRERPLFGIADDATGLKGVVHAADELGPLAIVGAGVDGFRLGRQLGEGKFDRETFNASADVAFDVAEAATIEFPPAAIGIAAAHLAFDGYEMLPPGVHEAIESHVVGAAKAVVNAEIDGVKADVRAVEDVGKAADHIVSGGVNGVKKMFGF